MVSKGTFVIAIVLFAMTVGCSNSDMSISKAKKLLDDLELSDQQYCRQNSPAGREIYDLITRENITEDKIESRLQELSGMAAFHLSGSLQAGLAKNIFLSIKKNKIKTADDLDAISVIECAKLRKK